MDKSNENSISLNKFISNTGISSRREADRWIEAGRVSINGNLAKKGNRVFDGDKVLLDGKPLIKPPKTLYIALNKPIGITCTTDRNVPDNITDFINHPQRLFPIGRLDKPSQGLIFLTNDGDIVNKILRAGNQHEKEYVVEVNKPVTVDFIKGMSDGVPILDTITKKCKVVKENTHRFRITLTQGLNRQIRRMCHHFSYQVTSLKRTRIMNVSLHGIPDGEWRELSKEELEGILEMVAHSSKTEEASKDDNKIKDVKD